MAGKTQEGKLKDGLRCAIGTGTLQSSLQAVLTVTPPETLLETLTGRQRRDALAWATARGKWERDAGVLRTARPPQMPKSLMQLLRLMCSMPHGAQMPEAGKLTGKQVKEYLAKGSSCPFCGSESITGGSVDIEGVAASQEVSCQECGRSWRDVYRLVNVEGIS